MDILKEASTITTKLVEMTRSLVLTGQKDKEEDEVEAYAKLIESREPLIARLNKINEGVDAAMASSPEFRLIRDNIDKIKELDEEHRSYMEAIRGTVQASHKEVRTGRRLHNAYVDVAPMSTSRSIDVTK